MENKQNQMAQGCTREPRYNRNVGKSPKRQVTRLQLGATCIQLGDLRCTIARVMGTWELLVVTGMIFDFEASMNIEVNA